MDAIRTLWLATAFLSVVGCAASTETRMNATPRAANALDVALASASAGTEMARGQKDEVVLAWNLEFIGDRARFLLCTAEDACGMRRVDVPAKSILAMKRVGRTRPVSDTGPMDETDVVRLTLTHDTTVSRGGAVVDPTRGIVIAAPPK